MNIGNFSVSTIFEKLKCHPYKIFLVYEIPEDVLDRRLRTSNVIDNILFLEKAMFYVGGHVNRQKNRYWFDRNTHYHSSGLKRRKRKTVLRKETEFIVQAFVGVSSVLEKLSQVEKRKKNAINVKKWNIE